MEIGYKLTDCENQKMYSNFTINSKNDKNVTAVFAFLSFGNQLQLYRLKDPELGKLNKKLRKQMSTSFLFKIKCSITFRILSYAQ